MALRLVPEHNNVIALRYAEDASPVRINVFCLLPPVGVLQGDLPLHPGDFEQHV